MYGHMQGWNNYDGILFDCYSCNCNSIVIAPALVAIRGRELTMIYFTAASDTLLAYSTSWLVGPAGYLGLNFDLGGAIAAWFHCYLKGSPLRQCLLKGSLHHIYP